MQVAPTLDTAILGVPGILIGLLLGYTFGGFESFRAIDRIGLGIISSIFAGVITSVVLMIYMTLTTFEAIFIVISYFGGYALGAASNWAPTPEKAPKTHIIYEPDDDDEAFDREIEETLRGEHKANKS
ncbi:MAG: hypothetical protein ACW96M_00345 [Candidatus Thorarchaeota archaeon]|jgi:hypothetical protein